MKKRYAIKDSEDKYAGKNSFYIIKKVQRWKYSFSDFLTNGFATYKCSEDCELDVKDLNSQAKNIGFDRVFHLEEIDLIEVMMKESAMEITSRTQEYIDILMQRSTTKR